MDINILLMLQSFREGKRAILERFPDPLRLVLWMGAE